MRGGGMLVVGSVVSQVPECQGAGAPGDRSYARFAGWYIMVAAQPQACAWGYHLMPATRARVAGGAAGWFVGSWFPTQIIDIPSLVG
jgi:hypothetical protein